MSARPLMSRPCIVCGTPTLDRSEPHRDPRCAQWLPCALRRNAARARPRPVTVIVAEAIELGHPVPREVLVAMKHADGREARARAGTQHRAGTRSSR